jgi:hypothetical protein
MLSRARGPGPRAEGEAMGLAARRWRVGVALLAAAGCASQPVLYPNAHYDAVGEEAAREDVEECRRLARAHGAEGATPAGSVARDTAGGVVVGGATGAATGAAVGAVLGNAGRGAAAGAAGGAAGGLIRSILRPRRGRHSVERAFIERCLAERGYDVMGWN